MTEIRKKPRGADPTKTRNKITKAARKLFVAKGFNGTSMSAIAKQANVTQSLLHHHFGNKESLWQHVKATILNEYFDDIEQQIKTQNNEHDSKTSMEKVLANRFHFMQNNPDGIRMALWQQLDNYQQNSTEKGRTLLKELINGMRQGQQQNIIRDDISPSMIVVITFILTSGFFQQDYQWILALGDDTCKNDTTKAEDQYLAAIQKIFIDGLLKK